MTLSAQHVLHWVGSCCPYIDNHIDCSVPCVTLNSLSGFSPVSATQLYQSLQPLPALWGLGRIEGGRLSFVCTVVVVSFWNWGLLPVSKLFSTKRCHGDMAADRPFPHFRAMGRLVLTGRVWNLLFGFMKYCWSFVHKMTSTQLLHLTHHR